MIFPFLTTRPSPEAFAADLESFGRICFDLEDCEDGTRPGGLGKTRRLLWDIPKRPKRPSCLETAHNRKQCAGNSTTCSAV